MRQSFAAPLSTYGWSNTLSVCDHGLHHRHGDPGPRQRQGDPPEGAQAEHPSDLGRLVQLSGDVLQRRKDQQRRQRRDLPDLHQLDEGDRQQSVLPEQDVVAVIEVEARAGC